MGTAVSTITVADVDASIARVIQSAESIWDEWAWQVENETWLVGDRWSSWEEMRREAYGSLTSISAPRAERPELVARFRNAGLTQTETASTLGVGTNTVARHEPEDLRGQRGPAKTPQTVGLTPEPDVVDAEIVEDDDPVHVNRETGEVVDSAPQPPAPTERSGVTRWSTTIQNISATIPMDELTEDEVLELRGAVEFLHNYIKGELITRERKIA